MNSFNFFITTLSILIIFLDQNVPCEAQLSETFYDGRCPNATTIIRNSIRRAISGERRMAASLLRLHFHDCFVQGCDASILLDQTSTIQSEKTAGPNANSVRGYDVVEAAKRDVERVCPGVVSCADILTLAARDASVAVGGPEWKVRLGRRDSTTANRFQADNDLPSPFSDLNRLISAFAIKGLNARDMVALSGSHTIGQAQCVLFRDRIYSNGTDVDAGFATIRRRRCPQNGGDSNLAPLDLVTPDKLDNKYFKNLMQRKGLLQSDQVLFSGSTATIVSDYSRNPRVFADDFAKAMIKMGEIEPLLGQNGIIRRRCSAIN
ncbi:Peroxidase superfamily protein [Perilla frutescens var. hirtella]|nr:Peroxidase superfamily protein [Perilla frutescens var. hirtella]KAH6805550.1 Peroxidase superfamily protein [Perilla frutescens var. frutescens]